MKEENGKFITVSKQSILRIYWLVVSALFSLFYKFFLAKIYRFEFYYSYKQNVLLIAEAPILLANYK